MKKMKVVAYLSKVKSDNDKAPALSLKLIPSQDGADWPELGAFWLTKTGNGFSGFIDLGEIPEDLDEVKEHGAF